MHKGTLGLATIDLTRAKSTTFPIGPLLPMTGFQLSPDRKRGYSVMPKIATGGNRATEWWVWDIANHTVIKKKEFEIASDIPFLGRRRWQAAVPVRRRFHARNLGRGDSGIEEADLPE